MGMDARDVRDGARIVYCECWRGVELRLEAKPVFSAEDGTPDIEKLRKADRCDTRPR
jgi:hypothetical protein